ncbi:MAG: glycosyltransferase family 39 protein [Anaerolineales bacterium]|nr:glycosyltransferase family 39 protein [Anaerolineales bacterium]
MTGSKVFLKKELPSWLPLVLAGLGAVLYLIRAVNYAHTTVSSLDEGSYLIKGLFYLNGTYHPFEPYGPLTNKAPFAFLIPGFAEYLFGAGLRTGRYFSIFLGLLTVLGVWITARRWAGNWMAAFTVWVFALSSMIVKLHARAVSEVIIACMLAWICALALDEKRPLWKIVLASVLASVAIFTRQNMAPLLPFLILYVFWQHGKRAGSWAFASGSIALLIFHLFYWPRVMTIWTPWLPEALTPFLDAFRIPTDSVPIWDPNIDVWNRLNAFFQGIRYHFIPIIGSFFGLILLPPRLADWKSASAMRAAFFLALSFFSLVLMHGWAALASQYESYSCVFCFSNYLGFFDPLGILFFVIAFTYAWNENPIRAVKIVSIFIVILVGTGIGYSLFEFVGNGLLDLPVVPRLRSGGLGFIAIVDALTQGLGMPLVAVKRWIGSSLGFIAALCVLLLAFFVSKRNRTNFIPALVNSFLITGFLLSPILHLGESRPDCAGTDIIRDHEELGAYLAAVIPPDSLVYWDGGNAFTPMIYVPQARIFPPQINDGYTFHIGGDPDVLYRFSHWNGELADRWRAEADVFIIEAKRYADWKDFLTPSEFREFAKPPVSQSCNEGAELRIFQRLP